MGERGIEFSLVWTGVFIEMGGGVWCVLDLLCSRRTVSTVMYMRLPTGALRIESLCSNPEMVVLLRGVSGLRVDVGVEERGMGGFGGLQEEC